MNRSHSVLLLSSILLFALFATTAQADRSSGLDRDARRELRDSDLNKYVGQFEPATSEEVGNGWTKHTFDSEGGEGPICIDGSDYTVFTRPGTHRKKTAVFLNGGGACWQDFYFCTPQADQDPPADIGVFAPSYDTGSEIIENPLEKYSMVYASYCDGSVFAGDNSVVDPSSPFGPVRHHRGLRNLTAAMDLARDEFGRPKKLFLSGASAGGVGTATWAPLIARFVFGNKPRIKNFNDAGPVAALLIPIPPIVAAIEARAADWQFEQFYPESCTECSPFNQATEIVKWRLDRDNRIAEAFYSTDQDITNRFFLGGLDGPTYRAVLTTVHADVNAAFPKTYKTFIRSGDNSHTALRFDRFYTATANGVPLHEWTDDFLHGGRGRPGWTDIVEDFVPAP
jgi:hypothetical protein